MHRIRFVMIGGFLGGGKTTTIARLARDYQAQGLKVGIVTNDQTSDLVDTESLRAAGHSVGEVAGSCFCCNFNGLLAAVEGLKTDERPDVILAEPVGSCTDLVATVIQPLRQLFDAQFDVAPYAVLLKPSHGRKILSGSGSGFSSKAAYIFTKQLEEADVVLINRLDELAAGEADELAQWVEQAAPGVPILRVSAKTGEGFEALEQFLQQRGAFGRRILDVDYDVYAEGEAELGWLNASLRVTAPRPFPLDELLLDLVARLGKALDKRSAETAHVKAIGMADGCYAVANLVSRDSSPELSLPARQAAQALDLIVNARVAIDPAELTALVKRSVEQACAAIGASAEWRQTQSFRPGRPVPTHRFAAAQ